MNIFDIMGPVMVGPSSSHTAGAARIGRVARSLLGEKPVEAELLMHGSFASTGKGHGTYQALIAGLLGMRPDDPRLPDSFRLAEEAGLKFTFGTCTLRDAHPNSVLIRMKGCKGHTLEVGACSPGGGRVKVFQVDGMDCDFSGEYPTLVIRNNDRPGCVSHITISLASLGLNLASLKLSRDSLGGNALMVIECDKSIPNSLVDEIRGLPGIQRVTRYVPEGQEEDV